MINNKSKTLKVIDKGFSMAAIEAARKVGESIGQASKYTGVSLEVFTLISSLSGALSSGVLMSFSQTLKMISRFRFIKVNYGALLGGFLEQTGDNLEPGSKMGKMSIINNATGTRGKLDKYKKSLSTFDLFHYKIFLYMASFIVRILTRIFVQKMKKNGKINKKLFYFVYYHNRIHFAILNMYLSGCVFLNARSILHLKYLPDSPFLIFDKYQNILCFFFYTYDIMELLFASLSTDKIATSTADDNKETKKDKAYTKVQEVKEILKKSKEEKDKKLELDDSVFTGINPSKRNKGVSPQMI